MGNGKWKMRLVSIVFLGLYFMGAGVAEAAGAHKTADISSLLHPAVNFALYVVLLVFIYKKYLSSEIKSASKSVADHIQRSSLQISEAESEAAVVTKRKSRLDDEKHGIVLQYKKEGEIQKDRIIASAIKKSDAVVNGVFTQAERELEQAKVAIQKEVFRQVLKDAGEKFQNMPPADDRRVRRGVIEAMLSKVE